MIRPIRYCLFLPLLAVLSACSSNPDAQVFVGNADAVNEKVTDYLSRQIGKLDTSKPAVFAGDTLVTRSWVKNFYNARQFKPAWTDKGKLSPGGDSLLSILRNAEDWGLIAEEYHVGLLDSFMRSTYDSAKKEYNVTKLAEADLMLTDGFFTFAVHASCGRMLNDSASARGWFAKRLDSTNAEGKLQQLISKASAANSVRASLESIEPSYPEYKAVKRYIPVFRKQYANTHWTKMPEATAEDSTEMKLAVLNRLKSLGDYDSTETIEGTDEHVKYVRFSRALKKFQKRYALEADGRIGKNTIRAMNMTVEDRIRQMAVILERWRIEPKRNEKAYMWVNLPAFRMKVIEADTLIMQSRIVCGAPKTQTPELDSKINQMILYPYWNVPWSIIKKEMIPVLKRDTGYLRKQRLEVIGKEGKIIDPKTIDWKKVSSGNFPYRLRQKTGDDNALGILKFEFSNPFGVYMHDTNSHSYFGRETRALSHGCMRLEKFMDLAYYLIRDDSVKLPRDTFDVYIKSGKQRRYNVRKPLPIHVRYFTADVDSDGNVMLLNDIYDRDKRMIKVLYARVDAKKNKSTANNQAPENNKSDKSKSVYFRNDPAYLRREQMV